VSRFFRSALFPLIVIVLLVYLASQTLLPRSDEAKKMTYSQLINAVEQQPSSVQDLVFNPKGRSIEAKVDGQKVKVNYPSDESQAQFQRILQAHDV
jgi:cell division protease FtsH